MPDSSHQMANYGVCWWWSYPHSADLRSRRPRMGSAPKEKGEKNREINYKKNRSEELERGHLNARREEEKEG